jgi:hypothetical protein
MDALTRAQALFTLQADAYVAAGYHDLADMTEAEFRGRLEPLRSALDRAIADGLALGTGPKRVPFTVAVTSRLVERGARVPSLRVPGRDISGVADRGHSGELDAYEDLGGLGIPDADAYLLLDVDRGDTYREIAPDDALVSLAARSRSPLTIDEGLSLATVHPAVLEVDAGFLLAGSRHGLRVPALWVTAGTPMLGWGGGATPETWLGVASTASRVAS